MIILKKPNEKFPNPPSLVSVGAREKGKPGQTEGKSALSGWHCPAVICHPASAVKNSQELLVVIPGWLVVIKVSRKLIVGLRMMKATSSQGFFRVTNNTVRKGWIPG